MAYSTQMQGGNNMKLIDRTELENRLGALEIDEEILEEVLDVIEDMPYLDVVKLSNGDLKGEWYEG